MNLKDRIEKMKKERKISDLEDKTDNVSTVNNTTVNSSNTGNVEINNTKTVNSNPNKESTPYEKEKNFDEKLDEILTEDNEKKEGLAKYIANTLNDGKSLTFYKILVREIDHTLLLESVSEAKIALREGRIKTGRAGAYLLGILRNKALPTKFKKERFI